MQLIVQSPKLSLNKAHLKEKVTRSNMELFKKNLVEFLNGIMKRKARSM